jgi:hypothetical protein
VSVMFPNTCQLCIRYEQQAQHPGGISRCAGLAGNHFLERGNGTFDAGCCACAQHDNKG